ncbi:MAG: hypothetical protein ACKE51_09110 [Methylococcaceae bacterium]
MNFFRSLTLRRALSLLLLFAALFSQIQSLYACESMADKPKHVCCCGEHSAAVCPMLDSCAMQQKSSATCCEVSYEVVNDAGMMNSVSTVDYLTLLLDGPQPPPDIGFVQFANIPSPTFASLLQVDDAPLIFSRTEATYLLTRRLRI